LNLYYSRGKETQFRDPELFNNSLQTKYNDGPVCFSKKGDEVWITRNNIEGSKVHKSKEKVVKLKLFTAKSNGSDWSKLEPFQFNNDEYNCAHPALSPDGKRLYFSSDMPGGKGGMDIYMCERTGTSWGRPINLGDTVNTKGNDMFPNVMDDGTLYFSSDGHPGIGGLDIFYTRDLGNRYLIPVNVGYPLNTSDDDFGMVYDMKNKIGYLSSNRANRGFDDDLYTFKKKSLRIKGIVVDKETGNPVKEARIELKTDDNAVNFTTGENGRFDFPGDFDIKYILKGAANGLGDTTINFTILGSTPNDAFVRVELGKPSAFAMKISVLDGETKQPLPGATIKDEVTGATLGATDLAGDYKQAIVPQKDEQILISMPGYRPKVIMLKGQEGETPQDLTYTVEMTPAKDVSPFENWYKIVYYDLDKFNIRQDALETMEEVVAFLKENPQVKISISSHTDSRATKEYNEKLSENRSKAIKKFLQDHDIPKQQIGTVTWSGEGVMVNKCGDDDPCTEEMHQLNRRTEITVNGILK
jgi:outer membrane protein OmpA-like peptidoglycan-associated protein